MRCFGINKLWRLAIGAIFVTTACSPIGPPAHSTVTEVYLLEWQPKTVDESTVKLNPACPTLLLSCPRAAPGYTGAGMAYIEEAHRIDYFANHRWADSPARMLEPLFMRALETSGFFQAVVQAPTTARFDLRLDTELLRLVQVFEAAASRIEITVRINLLDTHSQHVLVSEVIEVTEPVSEQTPYGGVIAANQAVARLLETLQHVLRPVVAPRCETQKPTA